MSKALATMEVPSDSSEVDQVELTLAVDEKIVRFDVPMDEATRVEIL